MLVDRVVDRGVVDRAAVAGDGTFVAAVDALDGLVAVASADVDRVDAIVLPVLFAVPFAVCFATAFTTAFPFPVPADRVVDLRPDTVLVTEDFFAVDDFFFLLPPARGLEFVDAFVTSFFATFLATFLAIFADS